MLKIFLRQSSEEFNGGKLCFRSSNLDTVTQEALVKEIAESNTTITQADTLAVLNVFNTILSKYLKKGYAVQTPFGLFFACAKGTAVSKEDSFMPSNPNNDHDIRIRFRPASSFADEIKRNIEIERVSNTLKTRVFIDSVTNAGGNAEAKVTPGECITVYGDYLKIDPEDAEQGIFLEKDNESYRLDYYTRNTKRYITARINQGLTSGSYSVKIVNRPTSRLWTTYYDDIIEIG